MRNLDGSALSSCIAGSPFSFVATFHVVTSSTSSRSNTGMYFATAGQASALTGACADNIISPQHSINSLCTGPGSPFSFCTGNGTGTSTNNLGSAQYVELDNGGAAGPDNCGDTNASSAVDIDVKIEGAQCQAAPGCTGTGCQVVLPACTSWQVPGQTNLCVSNPPNYPYPAPPAAVAGTPSKCNCNNTLTLPVTIITPGLGVTKKADPTSISGTDGGTSNYTVTVTNNANVGSETVKQICDDQYGNIVTASGFTPPCLAGSLCTGGVCSGGTNPGAACTRSNSSTICTGGGTCIANCATNITCPANGGSLALASPGDSVTCTFSGFVPENSTVTDTVTATAIASNGAPVSGTASATVTAGDAPASATFIKTLGSVNPTFGCATVVYNVEVDNSSGLTTDEAETLNTLLDDKYGDITTVHGNATTNLSVVSTTCAVTQPIPVNGKYTCSFDGVMCGTLGPLTSPTSCAAGLEVTDKLDGTLTGDETGQAVSTTPGSRTVEVCFVASSN